MSARSEGRWAVAISALLTSKSMADASRRSGIPQRTLQRWHQNPKFRELLASAYRVVVESAVRQVQQSMGKAAETLVAVLDDPLSTPADRIRASRTILDTGLAGMEKLDLIPEIEKLLARAAKNDRATEGNP